MTSLTPTLSAAAIAAYSPTLWPTTTSGAHAQPRLAPPAARRATSQPAQAGCSGSRTAPRAAPRSTSCARSYPSALRRLLVDRGRLGERPGRAPAPCPTRWLPCPGKQNATLLMTSPLSIPSRTSPTPAHRRTRPSARCRRRRCALHGRPRRAQPGSMPPTCCRSRSTLANTRSSGMPSLREAWSMIRRFAWWGTNTSISSTRRPGRIQAPLGGLHTHAGGELVDLGAVHLDVRRLGRVGRVAGRGNREQRRAAAVASRRRTRAGRSRRAAGRPPRRRRRTARRSSGRSSRAAGRTPPCRPPARCPPGRSRSGRTPAPARR